MRRTRGKAVRFIGLAAAGNDVVFRQKLGRDKVNAPFVYCLWKEM